MTPPLRRELREEILSYSLAGVEDIGSLLAKLLADLGHSAPPDLESWRGPDGNGHEISIPSGTAEHLRSALGIDFFEQLREIAAVRSWEPVTLRIL